MKVWGLEVQRVRRTQRAKSDHPIAPKVKVAYLCLQGFWGVIINLRMEKILIGLTLPPPSGWAIWYKNRVVAIPDEIISQIRAVPTEIQGEFEEELKQAWKHIFPITSESIRLGSLPLEHRALFVTPNPWWKFLTDIPEVSWEAAKELNKQRRPFVVPHWDESGWIIQERRLVDFRGMATAHLGNHPTLKLIQIMAPVKKYDVLLNCREDISGILKHMIIWKPEWGASKELLRKMGWSMVEATTMNINPQEIEVLLSQFIKMNVLLWNCRSALNQDFPRRIFEMAITIGQLFSW